MANNNSYEALKSVCRGDVRHKVNEALIDIDLQLNKHVQEKKDTGLLPTSIACATSQPLSSEHLQQWCILLKEQMIVQRGWPVNLLQCYRDESEYRNRGRFCVSWS